VSSAQDNGAVVRRFLDEVFVRGDLAAIDDLVAEQVTNVTTREPCASLWRRIAAMWRTAYPDPSFTVEDEVVQGEKVVLRVTMGGTHLGELRHPSIRVVAPTGRHRPRPAPRPGDHRAASSATGDVGSATRAPAASYRRIARGCWAGQPAAASRGYGSTEPGHRRARVERRSRHGGARDGPTYPERTEGTRMRDLFHRFAHATSLATGSAWAFILAAAVIVVWAATGPLFGFSDTWQLVINTSTTIVTFLMVFLIQNTQNRDARAIHLKLDELLRGVEGARTGMVDLEDCTDEELARYQEEFARIRDLRKRTPELAQRDADKLVEPEPGPGRGDRPPVR
jgi:low affinity Fe/Cu permease/predicted ester cyclase